MSAPLSSSARRHSMQPSRAANSSGVSPPRFMSLGRPSAVTRRCQSRTVERSFTSAPRDTRNRIISGWPCAAAHISAVCPPQASCAPTFAPFFSSSFAASTFPVRATTISGVWPSALVASAGAPASSSSRITSRWPVTAASISGVAPKRFAARTSAPPFTRLSHLLHVTGIGRLVQRGGAEPDQLGRARHDRPGQQPGQEHGDLSKAYSQRKLAADFASPLV
jgi:hypothetical protein